MPQQRSVPQRRPKPRGLTPLDRQKMATIRQCYTGEKPTRRSRRRRRQQPSSEVVQEHGRDSAEELMRTINSMEKLYPRQHLVELLNERSTSGPLSVQKLSDCAPAVDPWEEAAACRAAAPPVAADPLPPSFQVRRGHSLPAVCGC